MKFIICTGSIEYNLPKAVVELGLNPSELYRKPLEDMGDIVKTILKLIGEKE